jgi:hypothetical protein
MSYELKPLMRQKVLYDNTNAANPIYYQLVIDGAKVTPTSATATIYKRGSTTALVTSGAMTLVGSILHYHVDTTTEASWPLDTGYRAELSITYSSVVHTRLVVFDVVRYLLDLSVGVDQLIDIDDRVAGMIHNGSDDMPGLVVAARSVLQARLESKVLKDKKLLENTILDPSNLATAACFWILAQLWFDKGETAKADWYRKEYEDLSEAVLNNLRYDEAQDGEEDAEPGGIQQVRLYT